MKAYRVKKTVLVHDSPPHPVHMGGDDIVSSIRLPTPLQKPNNFPNNLFLIYTYTVVTIFPTCNS